LLNNKIFVVTLMLKLRPQDRIQIPLGDGNITYRVLTVDFKVDSIVLEAGGIKRSASYNELNRLHAKGSLTVLPRKAYVDEMARAGGRNYANATT